MKRSPIYSTIDVNCLSGKLFRNLLDIPNLVICSVTCDELNYDNDAPLFFLSREEAFEQVAAWNAAVTDTSYFYWCVVIEVGQTCSCGTLTMDEDGTGNLSFNQVPIRIVKPTKAERAKYGKRAKSAIRKAVAV